MNGVAIIMWLGGVALWLSTLFVIWHFQAGVENRLEAILKELRKEKR